MLQIIVDSIKRRLHRDVVSDPVSHGWVLNLYRAGERYPQTVCDYFPAAHAPWPELAADLERHRRDEERHTAMYAHAIGAIGQPVVELDGTDVLNTVIRTHTAASFTIDEGDDADARRRKIGHFMTHAYFLEKRVARSLEYHRDACAISGSRDAQRVVDAVLRDEGRHVRYTLAAARELFTHAEAEEAIEHHRDAEARANLDFSRLQIRQVIRKLGPNVGRHRRMMYRICAFVMDEAMAYV